MPRSQPNPPEQPERRRPTPQEVFPTNRAALAYAVEEAVARGTYSVEDIAFAAARLRYSRMRRALTARPDPDSPPILTYEGSEEDESFLRFVDQPRDEFLRTQARLFKNTVVRYINEHQVAMENSVLDPRYPRYRRSLASMVSLAEREIRLPQDEGNDYSYRRLLLGWCVPEQHFIVFSESREGRNTAHPVYLPHLGENDTLAQSFWGTATNRLVPIESLRPYVGSCRGHVSHFRCDECESRIDIMTAVSRVCGRCLSRTWLSELRPARLTFERRSQDVAWKKAARQFAFSLQ